MYRLLHGVRPGGDTLHFGLPASDEEQDIWARVGDRRAWWSACHSSHFSSYHQESGFESAASGLPREAQTITKSVPRVLSAEGGCSWRSTRCQRPEGLLPRAVTQKQPWPRSVLRGLSVPAVAGTCSKGRPVCCHMKWQEVCVSEARF